MKSINKIWVFSDSIKGHEIQSLTLANSLSRFVECYHCSIRQPWLSFAPRILPHFGRNIIWKNKQPDINTAAEVIITCGRRMAAVGKYFKRTTSAKHIHILNPGDSTRKYDMVIAPDHDRVTGKNVINCIGSLHNISIEELKNYDCGISSTPSVTLFLGNPSDNFFSKINDTAGLIQSELSEYELNICGSRRTPEKFHQLIKDSFTNAKSIWLSEKDGENPYLKHLACSSLFIVTADSINMVSETCATDKTVIVTGQKYVSPKHKRFIQSLGDRISDFSAAKQVKKIQPLNTLQQVVDRVISMI